VTTFASSRVKTISIKGDGECQGVKAAREEREEKRP